MKKNIKKLSTVFKRSARLALWLLPKGWLMCRGKRQCANVGRQ